MFKEENINETEENNNIHEIINQMLYAIEEIINITSDQFAQNITCIINKKNISKSIDSMFNLYFSELKDICDNLEVIETYTKESKLALLKYLTSDTNISSEDSIKNINKLALEIKIKLINYLFQLN